MKLFTTLCCTAANRMLVLFVILSCITSTVMGQNLQSKFLPPGSLIFRAFDNNIDGTGKDYLAITSLVYLEKGDKFSLTNATYVANQTGAHWEAAPRNSFASIEFQYLGIEPLEPSTNICFYIGLEGAVNVIDIFVNGEPGGSQFGISESIVGNTSNINLSSIDANSLYITQGEWYEENGEYNLQGNVVDGINIGSSLTDWQQTGIPNELGGSDISVGNTPGDYFGILNCNGAVYVCDFTDIQPILENWLISTQTDPVDLNPQEFCDHLCDVICDDCAFEVDIFLDNNCNLIAGDISCEAPYQYNWQRLQDGQWVNIVVSTSQDGTIDPLQNVFSDYPYRLVVYCDQYCEIESNPILATECNEECSNVISGDRTDCVLFVDVEDCNVPTGSIVYNWYRFENFTYTLIGSTTQPSFVIDQEGDYKVVVTGCGQCPDLEYYYFVNDIDIVASVNEIICCDYSVCVPVSTNQPIYNISLQDGTFLSDQPEFNFNYYNNDASLDDLVYDINRYLENNGLKGTARWQRSFQSGPKGGVTGCVSETGEPGFLLFIEGTAEDLFNTVFFFPEFTATFFENCYDANDGFVLDAIIPCVDYTDILWSTGETNTTSIIVPDIDATYTVTVACPNGCTWTSEITIEGTEEESDDDSESKYTLTIESIATEGQKSTTSVLTKEKSELDYVISPNPSLGRFTISANKHSTSSPKIIRIFSLQGELLAAYRDVVLPPENSSYQIDISHLSPSIYLLSISEGIEVFNQKIVLIK